MDSYGNMNDGSVDIYVDSGFISDEIVDINGAISLDNGSLETGLLGIPDPDHID